MVGTGHTIRLASGDSKWTMHGDFFDAWDKVELGQLVTTCLNTDRVDPCPNDFDA